VKNYFWSLLPSMLFASAIQCAAQVDAAVIAHYPFNGSLTADASGNGRVLSTPSSGSGTDPTFTGGVFGQAAVFDGAQNQSLWRGTADPGFDFGTGDFAVSLWYRRSSTSGTFSILGKGNASGSGSEADSGFALRVSGASSPTLSLFEGTDSVASATVAVNDVSNFQHVLFQRQGGEYQLYVNNNLEATSTPSPVFNLNTTLAFAAGAETVPTGNSGIQGSNFFSGAIDEIWVFNNALDLNQIQELFENNFFDSPSNNGPGAAIPEPGSVVLLYLGLLLFARKARRPCLLLA